MRRVLTVLMVLVMVLGSVSAASADAAQTATLPSGLEINLTACPS